MSDVETVKIKSENSPQGFVIINKSDFDRKLHELVADSEVTVERNVAFAKDEAGKLVELLGGEKLPAHVDVGSGKVVPSSEIVQAAHARASAANNGAVGPDQWNAPANEGNRDTAIQAEIAARKAASAASETGEPKKPAGWAKDAPKA